MIFGQINLDLRPQRQLAHQCRVASPAAAQDFFTLKGHGGPIMDIAVSPSGQIATASFDNSVGLWEGPQPQWLDGHRAAVNAVTFWGKDAILSGGDDFTLRLWRESDGKSQEIGKHLGKITDIAVSPDTHRIATASWDGTIGLWERVDTAQSNNAGPSFTHQSLTGHAQGVNATVFSKDSGTLYSASVDGTIRVWDVASGQEARLLVKHGFGVNRLILNEEDGWLAYGAVDGATRFIDPETGAQIADFTLERRPILSLAYDATQHQLAVGDGEGFIMVIDTKERRISRDFRATRRGPIWALAFSPDGNNIHAAGIEDILYSWPVATIDKHGQMAANTRSFLEDPKTLPNGERQFKRKCSICHALSDGSARKGGPTLYTLFGRKAGTVPDYAYSDILTGSEIIWSAETIDALFDLGPDHFIPGSKMPMQRITKQLDRNDLIDYLRSATAPTEN